VICRPDRRDEEHDQLATLGSSLQGLLPLLPGLQSALGIEVEKYIVPAMGDHSPSINTGGSCAAALLQLVSAGFTLQGVVSATYGFNGAPALVYTMVRTT
jgi:hypothetical protein